MTVPPSHIATLFPRDGGLHPPPDVILSWPKPNHIDPEERGWEAPILLLIVLGITSLVYIARIWARLILSKNAGLDDILISLAMIPLFGLTISTVLGIKIYGYQWHIWDQTNFTLVTVREFAMAIELTYLASTTLIKVSILCFYRRITGRLTLQFVYWVWGSIVFCVIYGIIFTALIVFTCSPVVGFFHLSDITWRIQNELTCLDEGAIIVACAAISTVQDFVICMLPIFLIWNVRISRRQKVGLCCIFGIGLVTCVCGILRTYYAAYVYNYTYDITWNAYYGWVWTTLEAQLSVICASAPALKVFFNRYCLASTSQYDNSKAKKSYGGPSGSISHHPQSLRRSTSRPPIMADGSLDSDIPLGGIRVSKGLDVRIHDRDAPSQQSFDSTRGLTTLSTQPGFKGTSSWIEGCSTVCAALSPGNSHIFRDRTRVEDVEIGRAI